MSLIYIGIVVLLHIYAKLGTSNKPVATVDAPTSEPHAETVTPPPSEAEQTEHIEPEAEAPEVNDLWSIVWLWD